MTSVPGVHGLGIFELGLCGRISGAMPINWQDVIIHIGSTLVSGTVVVGAAAWVIQKLISGRLERQADAFRIQLKADADAANERLKTSLQMMVLEHGERTTQTLRERVSLYKEALPPIIDLITRSQLDQESLTKAFVTEFEKKRLITTAMLGMFAALPVFEAYNALTDYVLDYLEGRRLFLFPEFRALGFKVLSEMRKDVGISKDELVYRGTR